MGMVGTGAPQSRQVPPSGSPTLTPFFTFQSPSKTLPEATSPPSHLVNLGWIMTHPLSHVSHPHHLGHEKWSLLSVPGSAPLLPQEWPCLEREAAPGLVPGELPPLVVLTLSSSHVL